MSKSKVEFLKIWALITLILIAGIVGFIGMMWGLTSLILMFPKVTLTILAIIFLGIISFLMTMITMEEPK